MNKKYVVPDIKDALQKKSFPQVTVWNRLEGRPRTHNLERALKAEIRDALWMLSRQYQLGEFFGDDAASPVFAKLHVAHEPLTVYQPGGASTQPLDQEVPLEAQVERRPIQFNQGNQTIAFDLRLLMGRHWLKQLRKAGLNQYIDKFIKEYPIPPPDPNNPQDAYICAHSEVWATMAAVAGRRMDGGELYLYLKADESHRASKPIDVPNGDHQAAIDDLGAKFIQWFERLFYQPPEPAQDAWLPDRLEYQFTIATPQSEKVFRAEEYFQGGLDWYNFNVGTGMASLADRSAAEKSEASDATTQTLIPTPLVFEGMPNTRWWAFEDRRTNFGDIHPDTTDIARMLLMEFGLVYANDWFLIPIPLKTSMAPSDTANLNSNSVFNVKGMVVTNVFGERFWIKPAGRSEASAWQNWSMFTFAPKENSTLPMDDSLLLLPTALQVHKGLAREQVVLIRDELANMVWAIEKNITLANGSTKPGAETARELYEFLARPFREKINWIKSRKEELEKKPETERTLADIDELTGLEEEMRQLLPPSANADIRYQIMSAVPEHWIPFIPVHVPGDYRQIQLQRASMLRVLEGDPNSRTKVRPRTSLLREGLEQKPSKPYYIHEEEVPRAGVQVIQSFRRARGRDGRVWVWLGVDKHAGRGEGSSGLTFDQIIATEKR